MQKGCIAPDKGGSKEPIVALAMVRVPFARYNRH